MRHAALLLLVPALACSPSNTTPDAGPKPDAGPVVPPVELCNHVGKPVSDWVEPAAPGTHRGEVAGDFTLEQVDGTTWTPRDDWEGCESFVFIPDTIVVSQLDATSVWELDLGVLLRNSPRNVHYIFVSRRTNAASAESAVNDTQAIVETELDRLAADDADHWRTHLHVAKDRAAALGGWLQEVLTTGMGQAGFSIDPHQRLRGFGSLADVKRLDRQLQNAGAWPWKANLAYAAYEAHYLNADAALTARLADEEVTTVDLFTGESLEEFADAEVTLPDAADMSVYDTLEAEITMRCPDEDKPEFGNCGAWDYLAHLYLLDGEERVELARFITTYHREAHWIVDATPALPLLKDGGARKFRWLWAPPWNKQPTRTFVRLRFSDRSKGHRAVTTTPLWTYASRPFDAAYNDDLPVHDVPIPADAKKVELVAIITGHGAATNQCAEFCDHQHAFTVGAETFTKSHPTIGDQSGCIAEHARGMTPNQGGTWWFGRGGWCPGQQVDPWTVDVTHLATPGRPLHLEYRGLYDGETPPDGSGDVHVNVRLVVSR